MIILKHSIFFLDAFQANPPRYLLKVDDDTFVNLPLLYNQLTTSDSYKGLEFLLMGNCFCSNPKRLEPVNFFVFINWFTYGTWNKFTSLIYIWSILKHMFFSRESQKKNFLVNGRYQIIYSMVTITLRC